MCQQLASAASTVGICCSCVLHHSQQAAHFLIILARHLALCVFSL
jgi:hypothetical protein